MSEGLTHDEFVCRGCGRLIFSFPAGWPAFADGVCGVCQGFPGWFNDPEVRDLVDPEFAAAQADARAWQATRRTNA